MADDYSVLLSEQSRAYLNDLDEKSRRICRDNLSTLANYPYPSRGPGDKEKIGFRGREAYRLHIGRTHTAFYRIREGESPPEVRVLDIMPIDDAHDAYEPL